MKRNVSAILDFLHKSEGLKRLLRHSWLSDGRQESVAEHSWRVALMALVLASKLETLVDLERVLSMIIIHDLAEIEVGDYHAFKGEIQDKLKREYEALRRLTKNLGWKSQEQILRLFREFAEQKTAEAKFVKALDKLEVLMQHNQADIKTWDEREYDFNLVYADKETSFSQALSSLRELIRQDTKEKIRRQKIR